MKLKLFSPLRFLLLSTMLLMSPGSHAQTQDAATKKQTSTLELELLRDRLEQAAARQKALREEITLLDQDVGAINRALIEAAKRGQELEQSVSETEETLAGLIVTQNNIRSSLKSKRGLLSEVLGALQRMGKNPPPAILVTPEDALASIRSAILLGAVIPEIRAETDTLFAELNALKETSQQVEIEKKQLADRLNALAEDETRLTLLVEEKNKLVTKSRKDLVAEQEMASDLAAKAISLTDLIGSLEGQIASAAAAAQAAKEADARRAKLEIERLNTARKKLTSLNSKQKTPESSLNEANTARIEPAIAFSKSIGILPRPVSGVELYGFGAVLNGRTRSTALALATRANARVRAPADSWVVYAGPFRSYGQILILNAGQGYHLVLSGLSEVNVEPGRFVLAGEPVGRMGTTRVAATATPELGSNKPVLSVELRKDGRPIDPSPWWAPRRKTGIQISSGRGT